MSKKNKKDNGFNDLALEKVFFLNDFPSLPKKLTRPSEDSKVVSKAKDGKKYSQVALSSKSYKFHMYMISKINHMFHFEGLDIKEIKSKQLDIKLNRKDLTGLIEPSNFLRDLRKIREELIAYELEIGIGSKRVWTNLAPGDWIIDETGVELAVSSALIKYFHPVIEEGGFAQYNLENIKKFKSAWTVPFYNELSTYLHATANTYTTPLMSVDFLRSNIFNVGDKYGSYGIFNLKVLKVAIKDINAYGHYNVEVAHEEKIGTKVVGLKFLLTRSEEDMQGTLQLEDSITLIPPAIESLLNGIKYKIYGKSKDFIVNLLMDFDEELFILAFNKYCLENKDSPDFLAKNLKSELPQILKAEAPEYLKAKKVLEMKEIKKAKIAEWKKKNPYSRWSKSFLKSWEKDAIEYKKDFDIELPQPTKNKIEAEWTLAAVASLSK